MHGGFPLWRAAIFIGAAFPLARIFRARRARSCRSNDQKFVDQIELMADGIYPYDFVHVPDQHEVGRPPATTLAMRCDGVETGDLITLNPDGTWKATQRLNIAGGHS